MENTDNRLDELVSMALTMIRGVTSIRRRTEEVSFLLRSFFRTQALSFTDDEDVELYIEFLGRAHNAEEDLTLRHMHLYFSAYNLQKAEKEKKATPTPPAANMVIEEVADTLLTEEDEEDRGHFIRKINGALAGNLGMLSVMGVLEGKKITNRDTDQFEQALIEKVLARRRRNGCMLCDGSGVSFFYYDTRDRRRVWTFPTYATLKVDFRRTLTIGDGLCVCDAGRRHPEFGQLAPDGKRRRTHMDRILSLEKRRSYLDSQQGHLASEPVQKKRKELNIPEPAKPEAPARIPAKPLDVADHVANQIDLQRRIKENRESMKKDVEMGLSIRDAVKQLPGGDIVEGDPPEQVDKLSQEELDALGDWADA